MFGIGLQEFGLILVVALLVFGPKRLPELARMLGRGMGEFRRASNDLRQSLALDDLQNDLRRDLDSARSMLKPDGKTKTDSGADRPAQAGDELPVTPKPLGETKPHTRPTSEPDKHQGELPLGNDYEHHSGSEPESESVPEPDAERGSDAAAEARSAPKSDSAAKSSPSSQNDVAARPKDEAESERE